MALSRYPDLAKTVRILQVTASRSWVGPMHECVAGAGSVLNDGEMEFLVISNIWPTSKLLLARC